MIREKGNGENSGNDDEINRRVHGSGGKMTVVEAEDLEPT